MTLPSETRNFSRVRTQLLPVFLLVAIGLSRATAQQKSGLQTLSDWMQGSFSSAEQARSDSNYYDIRLEVVRIWPQRNDGVWLYVEQAAAANLQKPYRQRVYHLTEEGDGIFSSKVYALKNPLRFAGQYDHPQPLAAISPDSLIDRVGCTVYLKEKTADSYSGRTDGKKCQSNLRGATYATSIVSVFADRLESWDQGFDVNDKQVWGATKGAYVFRRINKKTDVQEMKS